MIILGNKFLNKKNLSDGTALQNHLTAVHSGIFFENCPACQELKKKLDNLKKS